jgi:hypothetical protein
MLRLTDQQGADIRQVKDDLEEAGFKNITIKLHPSFERVGPKTEPLSVQIWPRLRVAIAFDVPAPPDQPDVYSKEVKK